MRADELRIDDLLEMDPRGGVVRFGGRRTLLLDAVALGLLRSQLVSTFGTTVTRALLTRLGFLHGSRTAESLRDALPWDDEREWRIAGGRLHRLQGLVSFEPVTPSQRLDPDAFAEAIWRDSYEAEQHVMHLGRATQCVCWTLAGFASGYLTYVTGTPVYCTELRCVGRGDAVCHMVGRRAAEWGDRLEEIRRPYDEDCLDESLEELRATLKRLEDEVRDRQRYLAPSDAPFDTHGLVAQSDAMKRVLAIADKASKVDATVLITGESGVGKERVARFVHDRSARAGGPFVAINCGALPASLLESELFGHARGAFTGASTDRAGLFEAAHGGTLLLDEIGELPLPLQVHLLRVLQSREVRRLGENRVRAVDVRVIAATNRRLSEMVSGGQFREDLYYRLQVIEIEVPPLRERPDDVLPLARVTLADASARMGREMRGLSPEASRALLAHRWPGNARELGNTMERAVALADGDRVELADLPDWARGDAHTSPTSTGTLADVERAHILATLRAHGGNRSLAAKALGIGEATLFRRIRQYRDDGFDV
jgi:DNA-binding NtrC family response regulator